MTITPGAITDYAYIRHQIHEITQKFDVRMVAYDPWNANHLVSQLTQQDGFVMAEHRQGFASMSPASKEFERLVLDGRLQDNHR